MTLVTSDMTDDPLAMTRMPDRQYRRRPKASIPANLPAGSPNTRGVPDYSRSMLGEMAWLTMISGSGDRLGLTLAGSSLATTHADSSVSASSSTA